jgi:hypothetical protein
MNKLFPLALAGVISLGAFGCGEASPPDKQKTEYKQVERSSAARPPVYLPKNMVEYNNYNFAQKTYDNPATILWCTTTFANPSAPILTVPVSGKLTSSSVSYFPNRKFVDRGEYTFTDEEAKSVDGMYHGSPAPYRYGRTPGGDYVEFNGLDTFCTTKLTKFQRQKTEVSVSSDPVADDASTKAEAILKQGTKSDGTITAAARKQAEAVLEGSGVEK